jgi:DNA-binding transcriptional LysR family regulator
MDGGNMHKISLEQWRMFVAVVDCGGFAPAGDALYKTQSTISHSIKKLEHTVGKTLFDVVGRKAVLTPYGESLLSAARTLVSHANTLEHEAISQKAELRHTLTIAVDTLFPRPVLFQLFANLCQHFPSLNIRIRGNTNSGWLGSASRMTVSSVSEAVVGLQQKLGFAWLPEWVLHLPENADIVPLPLLHGQIRTVALQIAIRERVIADIVSEKLLQMLTQQLN